MKNGLDLYKAISERKTASQRWNDLTDDERLRYTRLAEGVWHCDVHFGNDPDALKDGDGDEVYSFDSIYNDHSQYLSEEGRRNYENQR